VPLCKFLECEEALQSQPSVLRIFHPNADALFVRSYGRAVQDPGLSIWTLGDDDRIAQRCGDRDEVEVRVSASHCDARDGHSVQGIEAMISACVVVELKGCYSPCDGLSLRVNRVSLVVNKHQEDETLVSVGEAEIRLNRVGFSTNGEGNGVTWKCDDDILGKAQKRQCLEGEGGQETHCGGCDGEIDTGEVFDSGIGNAGIGVVRGRAAIENSLIDVFERLVWVREELGRGEGFDGNVERDELLVIPVTAWLGRRYEIHSGEL